MKKQEFSSLSLTTDFFKLFLDELHNTFLEKHKLKKLPKASQFYGYGNFDEKKPNLKTDLEELSNDFINGKYFYDKTREFYKGKPVIKINKYYKTILLLYIGYEDMKSFIDTNNLSTHEVDKQLSLTYDASSQETHYYLNYYFGEDNTIIKGQTIITNNWTKIQHIFIYREESGLNKELYNFGSITRREDTLHIRTKTLLDGKLVEGASETYYIGHADPSNVIFLIGTYTTFDIYTDIVAGKIILEKCSSKEEMIEKSKSSIIPPYIAQEIRGSRIVSKSTVPKNHLELSENSPYASIYGKIAGEYKLDFKFENNSTETLALKVLETNYKMIPLTENVYFEKNEISLINKGSILHFCINFAGIISLDKVDIYLKTYFLRNNNQKHKGVFSGIDNENRLINGEVHFLFNTKN